MTATANLAFDLEEPFAAIVFDCDGTLVDTAPVHFLAVNEAMRPFGLQMDAPWYYQRVGLTPQALFSDYELANNLTLDIPAREFAARKKALKPRKPVFHRGVLAKYADHVSQAHLGAITDGAL